MTTGLHLVKSYMLLLYHQLVIVDVAKNVIVIPIRSPRFIYYVRARHFFLRRKHDYETEGFHLALTIGVTCV